tara:strand:+ start:364 stop:597 length:234 start_codon:yes stop_codon:yes gene_type:complete
MKIAEYFKELEKHDWYYNYSDDHSVWRKGNENTKRLQAIAQEQPILGRMYTEYSVWIFSDLETREKGIPPKVEDYIF